MKQTTMKILFIIKKSNLLKNGEAPILVRITINGVYDEARIQRSILPKLWNQAKGCSNGRDKLSVELNNYIDTIRSKIYIIHKELVLEDSLITPSNLLKRLFNKEEKRTLLSTMLKEIQNMESLIGIDYEKVTINRYWNCYRSVKSCVESFYGKEDICFPELSREFVVYLDRYLRTEKKLCQNTLVRYMKCFKKFINMAFNLGWLRVNPFAGIQYKQEGTNPTLCGIDKNLTTHVARHTFGTTITLANRVSLENVAKMMGHTSTRMTQHYARVLDQTIMNDMEKVEMVLG